MESLEFIDYTLPAERIAAWPAARRFGSRDAARLLHASSSSLEPVIVDRFVRDLPEILRAGDLLVLNSSRVVPYRFFGHLADTGGEVELLLLERVARSEKNTLRFLAIANPMRKLSPGRVIFLTDELESVAERRTEDGERIWLSVRKRPTYAGESDKRSIEQLLAAGGSVPIPPYIRKGRSQRADSELYQTVFADTPGSIAAPTAGLHFTEDLLAQLAKHGVVLAYLQLHVGALSILPPRAGVVGAESFSIPEATMVKVRAAKAEGRRVIAVGTTTTRALESFALRPEEPSGFTSLFIRPGFEFKVVDALMTNFHQPGSTHLHMVNAFFGSSGVRGVYEHALAGEYQFLSYGDSMFLERAL